MTTQLSFQMPVNICPRWVNGPSAISKCILVHEYANKSANWKTSYDAIHRSCNMHKHKSKSHIKFTGLDDPPNYTDPIYIPLIKLRVVPSSLSRGRPDRQGGRWGDKQ